MDIRQRETPWGVRRSGEHERITSELRRRKTPTGHRYLYRVAIVIRVVPRENFLVPYWGEIFYFMK